uniref:MIP33008p1 n=1 Tax=Drosophila melanogaster TaxID=7227 RepID=G4LU35_DROME|nr:MIP33008p1 [Drosophila melanogaster]
MNNIFARPHPLPHPSSIRCSPPIAHRPSFDRFHNRTRTQFRWLERGGREVGR